MHQSPAHPARTAWLLASALLLAACGQSTPTQSHAAPSGPVQATTPVSAVTHLSPQVYEVQFQSVGTGTLQTSAQRLGGLNAQGLVSVPDQFTFTPLVNTTFVVSATGTRHVRASFEVTNNTSQTLSGLTFLPVVKTAGNGTAFSNIRYYDGSDASSKASSLHAVRAETYDLSTRQVADDPAATPFVTAQDISGVTKPTDVTSIQTSGWQLPGGLAPGAKTTVTFAVDFAVDAAGPGKDPFGFSLTFTPAQPAPPVPVTLTSAVKQYDKVSKTFGNYSRMVTLNSHSLPAYYDVTGDAVLCSFDPKVKLSNISDTDHPNRTRVEVTALGNHALDVYGGSACPAATGTPLQTQTVMGVALAPRVQPLAAGQSHSLALKTDGTVQSWGANYYGQLGDGTNDDSTMPVSVSGLMDVVSLAAGGNHSLALKVDGTVQSWGANYYGQLGDGTNDDSTMPVSVSGLMDVVSIAAGFDHSLALKADGTVQSWGYNNSGQLGDGTTTQRKAPVPVSGLTNIVGLTAGFAHSLALKADGTVQSWGYNDFGQLGYSTGQSEFQPTPMPIPGLIDAVTIASGTSHAIAVKADGTVQTWGANNFGQLGIGSVDQNPHTTPNSVSGLTNVVGIAAGFAHSLAVKADGSVQSWGWNNNGQLGDGTTTQRNAPVSVSDLTNVVSVAAGVNGIHTLALKSDGTMQSWGGNDSGQLGDGTNTDRNKPVSVLISGVAQPTP